MAARIRKIHHQQEVREKIRASQLINYMQKHALKAEGLKSAGTRVRAATALLNKCLPDLQTIQGPGPEGQHKLEIDVNW